MQQNHRASWLGRTLMCCLVQGTQVAAEGECRGHTGCPTISQTLSTMQADAGRSPGTHCLVL